MKIKTEDKTIFKQGKVQYEIMRVLIINAQQITRVLNIHAQCDLWRVIITKLNYCYVTNSFSLLLQCSNMAPLTANYFAVT